MIGGQKAGVDAQEYALMDAAEDGMWWYRALHARILAELPEHGRLLDAGCGTGGFLRRLREARPGLELSGIEYRPEAARRAAEKSGAAVIAGSINALPHPPRSFDVVVSLDVLCHAAVEEAMALGELRRVLRPGGLLVLNLPALPWLTSAHDRRVHTARRYTRAGIAALLARTGFVDIRARYWNSLLLPLMVLQRKLLARRADAPSDVMRFPPWLDSLLFAATRLESWLERRGIVFPAGGSVLATARRP
ncbi:MAG: class I SAM-dependent methyltransferase [Rhodovarius sp.]|nr:class I SAM-dependent methyltransferase [Rhodovarius sp.]MDW8314835.1 class I SAM-dependent methyltransferase [Rhodovarius sp.]